MEHSSSWLGPNIKPHLHCTTWFLVACATSRGPQWGNCVRRGQTRTSTEDKLSKEEAEFLDFLIEQAFAEYSADPVEKRLPVGRIRRGKSRSAD